MSDGMFRGIRIAATGLHAQRVKMDVVAENLANAETTRTDEGLPYRRQRATFAEQLARRLGRLGGGRFGPRHDAGLATTHAAHYPGGRLAARRAEQADGVKVAVGVAPEAAEFKVVFDPGHPDADPEGYVLLPNVNPITEMVDLIAATRAYEANASAVQAAKDMFTKALEI